MRYILIIILIVYIFYYIGRLLSKVLKRYLQLNIIAQRQAQSVERQAKPPWNQEEIEDADFKEIEKASPRGRSEDSNGSQN